MVLEENGEGKVFSESNKFLERIGEERTVINDNLGRKIN